MTGSAPNNQLRSTRQWAPGDWFAINYGGFFIEYYNAWFIEMALKFMLFFIIIKCGVLKCF